MKMVTFHANCVTTLDMDDFWLVGFADQEQSPKQYFMLQRGYEDDEQDVALGMNTYYAERDNQGWSGYGGIKRFELNRNSIRVIFTAEGCNQFETEGMKITFQSDEHQFSRLGDRLEKIFKGSDCFFMRGK